MSLARAFTTRRAKPSIDLKESNGSIPQRSNTTSKRLGYSGSIRHKISGPTELTHTTNMLAYNAPDLYPKSASSPSSRTSEDSDGNRTSASSPPTSPDIASTESNNATPEPNHLSCYFTAPGQKVPPQKVNRPDVPKIPQRALSHTKKASFDNLARQASLRGSNGSRGSISSKTSQSPSHSATPSTATSVSSSGFSLNRAQIPEVPEVEEKPADATSAPPRPVRQPSQRKPELSVSHPFRKELAQVSMIAEEFGVRDKLHIADEEAKELTRKGLCLFRAEDYLAEVQSLLSTFFVPEKVESQPVWI
ncbi:hypothetical protein KJ359_007674 [Pestalotiopsis sp. 9143b]|nr:hypothetical protein KJ359_007674 [Pestalotiopsis sp. 9143b]